MPKNTDVRREIWERAIYLREHIEDQVNIHYPIYIPSKARTRYKLTADVLKDHDLPFFIVVEPQDERDYRSKYGSSVVCLPENNQGVAYVRNFIKNHAAAAGHAFHWQIDDNIRRFTVRRDGKSVTINPRWALSCVEQITDSYGNIGGSCLSSNVYAFAFDHKEPVTFNVQIYSAMLLNSQTPQAFRQGVHEDTDYSLQILTDGYCTLVFRQINMEKAPSGQMSGGNTEIEYAEGKKIQRLHNTVTAWPDRFTIGRHRKGKLRLIPTNGYRGFNQIPKRPHPVT